MKTYALLALLAVATPAMPNSCEEEQPPPEPEPVISEYHERDLDCVLETTGKDYIYLCYNNKVPVLSLVIHDETVEVGKYTTKTSYERITIVDSEPIDGSIDIVCERTKEHDEDEEESCFYKTLYHHFFFGNKFEEAEEDFEKQKERFKEYVDIPNIEEIKPEKPKVVNFININDDPCVYEDLNNRIINYCISKNEESAEENFPMIPQIFIDGRCGPVDGVVDVIMGAEEGYRRDQDYEEHHELFDQADIKFNWIKLRLRKHIEVN